MPRISVQHCLVDFRADIQAAQDLFQDATQYFSILPGGKPRKISNFRLCNIAGLSLLRMHLSWEDFLERVFLRYMCGAKTLSGYMPNLTMAPALTISVAYNNLLKPGQNYLNWTPQNTRTWAANHFQAGQPFETAIAASLQTLTDISTVRNVFAHRSEFAKQKFQILVRRELGYLPRGISPGQFLLLTVPNQLTRPTYLYFYFVVLRGLANQIVP